MLKKVKKWSSGRGKRVMRTVAYLGGVDMERCPPPSGRRLDFSARNNLYLENNGLVGVVDGSWDIIIPYHVHEVCSKVMATFEENRIICPEAAVNGQFCLKNRFFLNCLKKSKFFQKFTWKNLNLFKMCLEKSKFFRNLLGKIEIFLKFAWKNRVFAWNCLKKIEISRKFAWKIEIFWPGSTTL